MEHFGRIERMLTLERELLPSLLEDDLRRSQAEVILIVHLERSYQSLSVRKVEMRNE